MAGDGRPKGSLRADARRNRAAIVRATIETLRRNPEASIPEIAAAAGVGRMTLIGHFPTRAELLEAALADAIERGEQTLSRLELAGDPRDVLVQLIDTSWMLVDESRALLAAAQKQLSPARIRELHEQAESRVRELLTWGQREGAFRADLPVHWLVSVTHLVMHGAATEVAAGRLKLDDASRVIRETLLGAFTSQNTGGSDLEATQVGDTEG